MEVVGGWGAAYKSKVVALITPLLLSPFPSTLPLPPLLSLSPPPPSALCLCLLERGAQPKEEESIKEVVRATFQQVQWWRVVVMGGGDGW